MLNKLVNKRLTSRTAAALRNFFEKTGSIFIEFKPIYDLFKGAHYYCYSPERLGCSQKLFRLRQLLNTKADFLEQSTEVFNLLTA